jgi:hypothetical protein
LENILAVSAENPTTAKKGMSKPNAKIAPTQRERKFANANNQLPLQGPGSGTFSISKKYR